jgi:hypothetical protein
MNDPWPFFFLKAVEEIPQTAFFLYKKGGKHDDWKKDSS